MTLFGWFLFFLVVQAIHFLGTWKLYVAAGRKAWEAALPIYNAVVLMKIINRPWWWVLLLFVPIVNLMMFPVVWVETIRSFGFNKGKDTLLVLVTFGLYTFYISYTQKLTHIPDRSLKPRTSGGEWISSILFAVVAATIVHTYFMQPFTIPSSSLEKTLKVGDYLFVSKFHYGARAPMTTVALPMVHDTIPLTKAKSYQKFPQLPYFRLPGFESIDRNDIVVFNWPVDTLVDISPNHMRGSVIKPIDKKTNYVKRCVGLPGDSLEVRDGYVFINGAQNQLPDRAKLQFMYFFKSSELLVQLNAEGKPINVPIPLFMDRYDVTEMGLISIDNGNNSKVFNYWAMLTTEAVDKLKNYPGVHSFVRQVAAKGESDRESKIFPYSPYYPFNNSNFGPIYIPKAGTTVAITVESIPFYKRIIEVYEGAEMGVENTITQSGNQILLNGEPLSQYTFKMDYYWMMGDNRDNSQDARTWGYVPFNHVVGKPVFIWFSSDKYKRFPQNIRWNRMFTTVGGSGAPVSYLKYFLIAVAAWFVFSFFRKKKKPKA
ncbi:MAG TPA: signal peptidase I [Flavobacteriaceae bacterium]|nr:signal peptidase I [Flavobacteriaceae bacterium]MCB9212443.1 signal peptidase I [Alteromonas sp.]HPF11719.1 signal peptidase I [Flavobacteriaceae bacterium]HQU20194.1 signal peptidase I [Flavobacteriaceae bacterium]HQU64717.1 signal peptidase I [Flavobacteriaceae bacterium]